MGDAVATGGRHAAVGAVSRADARDTAARRSDVLLASLCGAATAAYLSVLLPRLAGLRHSLEANADTSIPALLAGALGSGRSIWLPSDTFADAIWFDWATRWLPGHRLLWDWWPYSLTLIAGLAVVWAVARVAGGRAALLAGVSCLSLPPAALVGLLPQDFHGTTAIRTALLGALLVAVADGCFPGRRLWAVAAVAGTALGIGLVSDPLLVVTAVAPLLVAVALVRTRGPKGVASMRLVAFAAGVSGVALLAMAAGTFALRFLDVAILPAEGAGARVAPLAALPSRLEALWLDLAQIVDGRRLGQAVVPVDAPVAAVLLAGFAVGVGAVVAHRLGRGARRDAVARLREGDASTVLGPCSGPLRRDEAVDSRVGVGGVGDAAGSSLRPWRGPADPAAARVHLAYWSSSLVLLLVSTLLVAPVLDASTVRYLTSAIFAIAALVPLLLAPGRPRWPGVAATAAVLLVSALATVGVSAVPLAAYSGGRVAVDLDRLAASLLTRGLHRGYADYWDAGALTAWTDGALEVRPVMTGRGCATSDPGAVCAYHWNTADAWYVPRAAGPTFVVVAPEAACMEGPLSARLGRPISVLRVGTATVVVYPDDVAARFVRSRAPFCPP